MMRAFLLFSLAAACAAAPSAVSLSGELMTCRGSLCDPSFSKEPLGEERAFVFVATAGPGTGRARLDVRVNVGLKDGEDGAVVLGFLDGSRRSDANGASALRRFMCEEAVLSLSLGDVFAGCAPGAACRREIPVRFHTTGDGLVVGGWMATLIPEDASIGALKLEAH